MKKTEKVLFGHTGKKIKTVATVLFFAGVVLSVVLSVVMFVRANRTVRFWGMAYRATNRMMVITGIVNLILGPLFSWVCSLCLYGFGTLVCNSTVIAGTGCDCKKKEDCEKKGEVSGETPVTSE